MPVPGRVLVVDDNYDAATTLAMVLRNFGHTVFTAHDGESALRTGEQEEPDALILDIGMPDMNGYEVAQRVRRTAWGNEVLLVALTGWGQKEDVDRALRSGFDAHLTKPADPERIERLLEDFLAERNETGDEPARSFP
jgi:CheY-like chemotaxis protein